MTGGEGRVLDRLSNVVLAGSKLRSGKVVWHGRSFAPSGTLRRQSRALTLELREQHGIRERSQDGRQRLMLPKH